MILSAQSSVHDEDDDDDDELYLNIIHNNEKM